MSAGSGRMVRPLPGSLVVHLVNEWGDAPREAAHEEQQPYPSRASLRSADPELWAQVRMPVEAELVAIANLLHPVFTAPSGAECAARLSELVVAARLAPRIDAEGWTVRVGWQAPSDRAVLAGAVLTLLEQLRSDPDATRLGTCSGEDCVDVYVDRSPARRRRFCSLTCQNRERARAYRSQRRAGEGAAS